MLLERTIETGRGEYFEKRGSENSLMAAGPSSSVIKKKRRKRRRWRISAEKGTDKALLTRLHTVFHKTTSK